MALRIRHWTLGEPYPGTVDRLVFTPHKGGLPSTWLPTSTDSVQRSNSLYTVRCKDEKRSAILPNKLCEKQSIRELYYGLLTGEVAFAPWIIPVDGDVAVTYTCYELVNLIKAEAVRTGVVFPSHDIADCDAVFGSSNLGLPRQVRIDRDPFETDFSIWFPIVDIIQLVVPFYRSVKVLKSIRHDKTFTELLKKNTHFTARDFHNRGLGVKFGLLPTISDIRETVSAVLGITKRYDEYKKKYKDHVFRFHEKRDIPGYYDPPRVHTGQINLDRYPGRTCHWKVDITTNTHFWHGQTFYKLLVPELGSFISRLKQLIDSFGLLDPAALWDLVPFSFILDWFFTTDRVMHSLKPRLFHVTYELLAYLESVNLQTQIRYYVSGYSPNYTDCSEFSNLYIGSTTYKSYVRRPYRIPLVFSEAPKETPDPDDPASIERFFSSLDKDIKRGIKPPWRAFCVFNRISTAANLIGQRIPR